MTISKAEALVRPALDRFSEFTGSIVRTQVYLMAENETGSDRQEIFAELGARFEQFQQGTRSETVYGSKGYAILMYPFNTFSVYEFTHCLMHECGHILFRSANPVLAEKYTTQSLNDEAHMGYALFDEFIAEALANYADADKAVYDSENVRAQLVHLLFSAVPGINREPTRQAMEETALFMRSCIYVIPGQLGRYAAMKLTDPTIVRMLNEDPGADTGLAACGMELSAETDAICQKLSAYLNAYTDAAYTDEAFLASIGKHIIRIWNLRMAVRKRCH